MIIIKKYANRKLYSTELSKYVTLSDIRDMKNSGKLFKVIEMKKFTDITEEVLLRADFLLKLDNLKQENLDV